MFSPRLVRPAPAGRRAGGGGRSFIRLGLAGGTLFACVQILPAKDPLPGSRGPAEAATSPIVSLPLPEALAADPGNTGAWRLAADLLEAADNPQAIELRRGVVISEPDALENRLALIHTALRFGDLPTGEHTFDDLAAFAPPSIAYREAAAAVALAGGSPDKARRLLGLGSGNEAEQKAGELRAAAFDLRLESPKVAALARKKLLADRLIHPSDRVVARELIRDAVRNSDEAVALQLAAEIASPADAAFADQLRQADVQLLYRRLDLPAAIKSLGSRAATTPTSAALLVNWLIARGATGAAQTWLASLPAAVADTREVRSARADGFAAAKDWTSALPLIQTGAWGPIAPALVLRANAIRSLAAGESRLAAWTEILGDAHGDAAALRVLHRLAVSWKMTAERTALLLSLARGHPENGWAFQALVDEALREKNTPRLLSLYNLWHETAPDNLTVESHRLLLTVLTTPKPTPELRATIERLVIYNPEQPLLVTARALILWQLGRADEALAVTESIRGTDRRFATRAFYHGLFVASSGGRADEAQAYLALSEKAPLLPEETALIQAARDALSKGARR